MIGFFKFFVVLLLIAIAVFLILCTNYGYECHLPNGGYFKIRWKESEKKFDIFYWRPKGKAKPLPENVIKIDGQKENCTNNN